ncbi:hypothetical protein J1N35_013499 [Gossypium stocksii]|uniref:RNase H type-1 domain-containing protein n=1 Tax=Gossypium stocksii TaxID=47602 RepID=A0A9D3VTV2_9ROSI|nr:hypothetical protein J1N35_013499 [Gossypium stocksii]
MTPPPERWHKLNKDGGVNNATGAAVGGAFIRDSSGCWVMGYSWTIGCCSLLLAEHWELCDGLSVAWDAGIRCLVVKSDNRAAVTL